MFQRTKFIYCRNWIRREIRKCSRGGGFCMKMRSLYQVWTSKTASIDRIRNQLVRNRITNGSLIVGWAASNCESKEWRNRSGVIHWKRKRSSSHLSALLHTLCLKCYENWKGSLPRRRKSCYWYFVWLMKKCFSVTKQESFMLAENGFSPPQSDWTTLLFLLGISQEMQIIV